MKNTSIATIGFSVMAGPALAHVDAVSHWHESDALMVGIALAVGAAAVLLRARR